MGSEKLAGLSSLCCSTDHTTLSGSVYQELHRGRVGQIQGRSLQSGCGHPEEEGAADYARAGQWSPSPPWRQGRLCHPHGLRRWVLDMAVTAPRFQTHSGRRLVFTHTHTRLPRFLPWAEASRIRLLVLLLIPGLYTHAATPSFYMHPGKSELRSSYMYDCRLGWATHLF